LKEPDPVANIEKAPATELPPVVPAPEGELADPKAAAMIVDPTASAVTEVPAIKSITPGVQKISFQYADDQKTPGIEISLNGRPEFKLTRKGDREYQLVIQGSKLSGDYLSLAQYPPQDFDGFTHVMATNRKGNSEVIIGVERGTKLTAYTKDGNVWVKIASPL